jgi:uncharacterized membrane protein
MISQCDLSEEILPLRPFNIKSLQTKKDIARISLALLFIVASTLHFTSDVELKLIPPFLPWRREALYITGICELLGGIGLLIPRFQRAAAWSLVALLIAIFPANVYHAVKNIHLGGITDYPLYHWIRLPFQAVFIWWALWSTSN